jgi:hypothetical protein
MTEKLLTYARRGLDALICRWSGDARVSARSNYRFRR